MIGLAYAAVPLYDLFCRVTGFAGTPLRRTAGGAPVLDRSVAVRFDANVAPGLDWRFTPETPEIEARVGETQTVFYRVTQRRPAAAPPASRPSTSSPARPAPISSRSSASASQEQTLKPGETMESPVVFYIDPPSPTSPTSSTSKSITLSYTYFPSKDGQPVAAASATAAKPKPISRP